MRLTSGKNFGLFIVFCLFLHPVICWGDVAFYPEGESRIRSDQAGKIDRQQLKKDFEKIASTVFERCSYPHGWENQSFVNYDPSNLACASVFVAEGKYWFDGYRKESFSAGIYVDNQVCLEEIKVVIAKSSRKCADGQTDDMKIFDPVSLAWECAKIDDYNRSEYPDFVLEAKNYWCKQRPTNDVRKAELKIKHKSDEQFIEILNEDSKQNDTVPATLKEESVHLQSGFADEFSVMLGNTPTANIAFVLLSILGIGLVQRN